MELQTFSVPPIIEDAVEGITKALCSVLFHPSKCAYSSFSALGGAFKKTKNICTMPKTSTQLILSERREPRARLCSKQLTINNVDDRKEAKKIGKSSSSGVKTHNCLQFGRQILEFAALCILQHLVIRNINQLHMPTEDLCRWAELLTNGGF